MWWLCHIAGMDGEIDLRTADRDVLIGIIIRQQAIIERLEKRVAQSEGKGKSGGSGRMPGLKPKGDGRADRPKKPRQPRRSGFARTRMTPDQRMEHALERCPDCGIKLSGGWTQRTREVIELPQVPVQVTEHAYIARACPQCHRRWVPPAELDEVVLGQQRLGINLVSLIAALREEARLPFRTIQWYLAAVHGRRLSVGAIVGATPRVADRAQGMMTDIVERIRGSPVVCADETGWREDGHNGYVWTFSTPTQRYFLHATSCGGDAAKPWWMRSWAMSLPGCWSATAMPPTTTMTAPSSAAGHICCETSTTGASSTPTISRWSSGRKPSTNSTNRPKPSPTSQSNGQSSSDALPNWPWNDGCWRCAVPTGMTRRRRRPDCADASVTTSRNSSSSWLIRRCRRTTTPPSAACAIW